MRCRLWLRTRASRCGQRQPLRLPGRRAFARRRLRFGGNDADDPSAAAPGRDAARSVLLRPAIRNRIVGGFGSGVAVVGSEQHGCQGAVHSIRLTLKRDAHASGMSTFNLCSHSKRYRDSARERLKWTSVHFSVHCAVPGARPWTVHSPGLASKAKPTTPRRRRLRFCGTDDPPPSHRGQERGCNVRGGV